MVVQKNPPKVGSEAASDEDAEDVQQRNELDAQNQLLRQGTYFLQSVAFYCLKVILLLFIATAEIDRQVTAAESEVAHLQAVVEERERELHQQEEELLAMIRRERAHRLALRAERDASAKSAKK